MNKVNKYMTLMNVANSSGIYSCEVQYQMLEQKFQRFFIAESFSLGDKLLLPRGQLLQV